MSPTFLRSNKPLCDACRGINYESLTATGGYKHSLTRAELASGYVPDPDGCLMCFMTFGRTSVRDPIDIEGTPATGPIHLSIGKLRRGGRPGRRLQVRGVPTISIPSSDRFVLGSPIAGLASTTRDALIDTSTNSSIQGACQWLKTCIQEHTCAAEYSNIELFSEQSSKADYGSNGGQKRLVDLMAFGGDVVTSRYQTTIATLPSQISRIDHSEMPLTIRDAFEITRALNIRYIWIDALCIIQDSKPDWEVESSKMGSIYSQALVTIAADYGNSAHSGYYNRGNNCALSPRDHDIEITRENYSKRELTIASDKLPAISALARLWSQYTHSSYLAGIWRADIHLGLAWSRLPYGKGSRPLQYRSPSWSWAALDLKVSWGWNFVGNFPNKSRIEVLEAQVILDGHNTFGGMTGGWLKATGRAQTLSVQYHDSGRTTLHTTSGDPLRGDIQVFMDILEDIPQEVVGLLLSSNSGPNNLPSYVLILVPNQSDPQKYVRKGLAEVSGSEDGKMFDEWDEWTMVLI
ncbi:uncharacterized protein PAC_06003 [Phialocephala subalpina]|uniref:Heterokaryon incompatibility domain-containing protein n=1 Tax=Phialocephala subalpina TaxID=576137 RepID=A0A1L7WTK2_9HELO|nr:uncharacterized protein PAC_06003 [Phialocephala subalpina]